MTKKISGILLETTRTIKPLCPLHGIVIRGDRLKTLLLIFLTFYFICFYSSGEVFSQQIEAQSPPIKTDIQKGSPFHSIKETYSSLNTMDARFRQKIFISNLRKGREFDGEFYYKRGRGFLWRYTTPKIKYFLYDGKFIWQGEEDKNFILKDRVNREKTGGTFLDLIEDMAKMDELFTLKTRVREGDLDMLELIPRKDATVKSAQIWVDSHNWVKKITIQEFTGNINTIEFFSIKPNRPVDDSKLIFKAEPGKEIVER